MVGRTQPLEPPFQGARAVEQARLDLDPQDPAHGVVQARRRDLAAAHLRQGVGVEALPAVGGHEHVDTRVERGRAVLVRAAWNLAVRVPVADDEAFKAHPALQHAGQKVPVCVVLDPLPA